MKTSKKEEFIRKFMKVPAAKTGEKKQVYISEENYECLTLIAQKLSKNKFDLSGYLDNILADHITRYGKTAIELNRERIREEMIENSLKKS
ncbi:DUF3408 domain-containing protein [Bacteroides oleiciplenus]|uniref:DUF3408 domain-containing protein n=1 Tax=Bacteroides oleiciplenus YIT 12058 TaxID=742727 RepID=K9DV02_9BACE|nr:DUF3408 domain-containing protein [Bacteroides oleiciplenus]EKU88749.1 hypothetical protein HMPREF9447_04067 [Bacteroides oleiciplenus YIT 12058]